MSTLLRAERGQHGAELRASCGEAGTGIYAFIPSASLRRYYTAAGEQLFELDLDPARVVDLTALGNMAELLQYARSEFRRRAAEVAGYREPQVSASTIQRFGSIVEAFVRAHRPWAAAWIVPHVGPGIPRGKQVVIADPSVILEARRRAPGRGPETARPRPRP